ncbi:MAG TPA: ion transporter [Methanothermococcus okinawensis]|uniref:Ion transporter n=1 Tax=Methanothermococcus okinawensis TaxID=155863 RepID=A0A832ZXU5_9EURY|nr:ion transporter [Methanothermococcus okinawensis]
MGLSLKALRERIYHPRVYNTLELIGILCTLEILISFILSTYHPPYEHILIKLDFISISILSLHFLYKFMGTREKLRFLANIYNIIDAVVIGAFILYLLQIWATNAIISLRIINAVRILVLLRIVKFKHLRLSREMINFITILTYSFIISSFIWLVENEVNPGINNFADAFYFTVISLTTVGYGDITPVTPWGKGIIVLSILYLVSGLITKIQSLLYRELERKRDEGVG